MAENSNWRGVSSLEDIEVEQSRGVALPVMQWRNLVEHPRISAGTLERPSCRSRDIVALEVYSRHSQD